MARDRGVPPPSGMTARLFAVVSLAIPVVLPIALFFARRARHEASASEGAFTWPSRLVDRPLVLYVVVWFAFLVLALALTLVMSTVFNVSPV